ncbi:uncharacterized protein ACWYII_031333 isoform 1-T1 [Salvelinus alpinus]
MLLEMSEVIYAEPDMTKKVKFDRGEMEEMIVDIYVSADTLRDGETSTKREETADTAPNNEPGDQHSEPDSSVKRPFLVAAVCLGLLCVLLAGIIGLSVYYGGASKSFLAYKTNSSAERIQLQTIYNNLTKERVQLQTSNSTLTKERDQLQTSYNNMTIERDQLHTRYNNLTKERVQLQTSNSTLTKERDQLQTSYNNMTIERDQLQTRYNNLTKEREQLQTRYNNLTKERDEVQTRYNNLSKEIDQLQRERNDFEVWYYISTKTKNWNGKQTGLYQQSLAASFINTTTTTS